MAAKCTNCGAERTDSDRLLAAESRLCTACRAATRRAYKAKTWEALAEYAYAVNPAHRAYERTLSSKYEKSGMTPAQILNEIVQPARLAYHNADAAARPIHDARVAEAKREFAIAWRGDASS